MNTLISVVNQIKKTYLNASAELEELSTQFENEIMHFEGKLPESLQKELFSLFQSVVFDSEKNLARCLQLSHLHNELKPPSYIFSKKNTVPYLRRVK